MILKAGDTISGQEGKATAKINGQIVDMFYIKTLEATVEKNKLEVRTLGKRGVQHKTTGWTGTGSMTIYYVTSDFVRMAKDYVKNGVDTYFTITIENNDPTSTIGVQTVTLYDVNIDAIPITKVSVEDEVLECDMDFTFQDLDLTSEFNVPAV